MTFNSGISNSVNLKISNADTITFWKEAVINDVMCGRLELMKNGKTFDLTTTLLNEKSIKIDEKLFKESKCG